MTHGCSAPSLWVVRPTRAAPVTPRTVPLRGADLGDCAGMAQELLDWLEALSRIIKLLKDIAPCVRYLVTWWRSRAKSQRDRGPSIAIGPLTKDARHAGCGVRTRQSHRGRAGRCRSCGRTAGGNGSAEGPWILPLVKAQAVEQSAKRALLLLHQKSLRCPSLRPADCSRPRRRCDA